MRRRECLGGVLGLAGGLLPGPLSAWAADPATVVGVWRTIDDKTNKPRALVQIFVRNGLLFGRVTAILDSRYAAALCQDCTGDRANQPVLGLEIIRDMQPDGNRWDGGTILNPETGDVYHCRFHVGPDGQTLVVRGFIGISVIGRSQIWQRVPGGEPGNDAAPVAGPCRAQGRFPAPARPASAADSCWMLPPSTITL